ncbi:MAG: hypothetical protein VX254_00030 [Planctomycetota bacterium]|nr:hypothetical protein [Planctomycetota bacterium]
MNKAQKVILGAGVVLAVAMLVYPPWIRTDAIEHLGSGNEGASGHGVTEYRLIISDTKKVRDPDWGKWATTDYWDLDLKRLLLQLFGLTLVVGVSYVIAGGRKGAQVEAAEPKDDDTPS